MNSLLQLTYLPITANQNQSQNQCCIYCNFYLYGIRDLKVIDFSNFWSICTAKNADKSLFHSLPINPNTQH